MNNIKCNRCICKTCLIAYENGAAEGCGNCLSCLIDDDSPVNSCASYINNNQDDFVTINITRRRDSLVNLYELFKDLYKLENKYEILFDTKNDKVYLKKRKFDDNNEVNEDI